MGHSRPKYNSAVSTFCWAVANNESFTVNDPSTELELLYIDDLVEGIGIIMIVMIIMSRQGLLQIIIQSGCRSV